MFLPLFWARIYGCLNSVEKLRSVSPTHNNEEMDVPLGSQPKKELTSASYFIIFSMATYSQWSQSYFVNDTSRDDIVVADLTPEQHEVNNEWFKSMLSMLTPDGQLYVPCLNKSFNKLGEEINNDI